MNPFRKLPATERVQGILDQFDNQVITLEQACAEIDSEIVDLTTRVRLLDTLSKRAAGVAAKLRELCA